MTSVQNKGFPLAGLLSNVMVQDSAKYFAQYLAKLSLNLSKLDIVTARNGVSRQVRAIEENFPSITTRGGKVLLQSPREGGSLSAKLQTPLLISGIPSWLA